MVGGIGLEPVTSCVEALLLKGGGRLPMLSRLGKRAGISEVSCSPHTMRHTFAKQYLMCGGDVFSLQRILGHSSLEVVKIYINLLSSEICKQHSKFSPADNMDMAGSRQGKRLALPAVSKTNQTSLLYGR